MQEKDISSIEYFEDEERFADIINGHLFKGKKYILPEDVQERKRSLFMKWKRSGQKEMRTLYRDIVRLVKMKMKVVLIAMENQDKIHYAMPVRVMTEDSGSYYEQWKKIARHHRKRKDLRGAEFLSGIAKDEKLVPVITIVVYFGKEPWDGPRSVREMLDLDGLPEEIREMIEDGRCEGRSEGEELAIRVMKLKLQGMSAKEIAKKSGIQQEKVDEILRKFAA